MDRLRLGVLDNGLRFGTAFVGYLDREGIAADLHRDAGGLLAGLSGGSPPSLVVLNGEAGGGGDRGGAPDAALLDTLLRIRDLSRIPCVIVGGEAAAADPERSVRLLEAGADDLISRTTAMPTMLARMRAVLRRAAWGMPVAAGGGDGGAAAADVAPPPSPPCWRLLRGRRELRRPDGTECPLTTAEFDLFCLLAEASPEAVSREAIARSVFRRRWHAADRTVDILVVRLRRKLDVAGRGAIRTVQRRGYMFTGFDGVPLRIG